jgi:hypothetical protein
MSLRTYIIGLVIGTVLCSASWVMTILYVDPSEAKIFGALLFYMSLALGITGLASLIGFYLRILFSQNEVIFAHVTPSFRQGALISLCILILLVLQSFRLLTWWDILLVVLIVSLTEFFFHSRQLAS